ncbi:hypothetical protein GCM10008955_33060 [Deinococcus malanensis]|uniref:Uncharacterized protein n=1 Tax=Deinococcus malanensis TaxID=1706855 RepID=A0ABQ2F047_9DEIO|nr:hypothetical protein GCM10008955_33060 [Deinococcus malanensis]
MHMVELFEHFFLMDERAAMVSHKQVGNAHQAMGVDQVLLVPRPFGILVRLMCLLQNHGRVTRTDCHPGSQTMCAGLEGWMT